MIAIIGGEPHRLGILMKLYHDAGKGETLSEEIESWVHTMDFLSNMTQQGALP